MKRSFAESLVYGQSREAVIAQFLEDEYGTESVERWDMLNPGPRLLLNGRPLIAPDRLATAPDGSQFWWDGKAKGTWAWYETNELWQTGIDEKYWLDYIAVSRETGLPCRLYFLHETDRTYVRPKAPKPTTPVPAPGLYRATLHPTGLFVGQRWFGSPSQPTKMVYWNLREHADTDYGLRKVG